MNPYTFLQSAVKHFAAELEANKDLPPVVVTSDINRKYEAGNFIIYVRLGSIETINDLTHCPIQRCGIVLELIYPDTSAKAYVGLYDVFNEVHKIYTKWQVDLDGWDKATNHLTADGTIPLENGLGVGMTCRFEADAQFPV